MDVSAARQHPVIGPLADAADYLDLSTCAGDASLQEFVAALVRYQPAWVRWLFRIRGVVARLLGLKHEEPTGGPEALELAPGTRVDFFTTHAAVEGDHWVGEIDDRHLWAALAVWTEDAGTARRIHVSTIVRHHGRLGRVYFAAIRPFHRLIQDASVADACRRLGLTRVR